MSDKIVLAICGASGNDAIRGVLMAYADALATQGLSVVQVAPEQAELDYALEQMIAGKVMFGFTWLGIAQELSIAVGPRRTPTNAWEACGVPLLKLHGDIPAYYPQLHDVVPTNAVNLYGASEMVAFRTRWMPQATTLAAVVPPLPLLPIDRAKANPARRRVGKLVFLKNGNSAADLSAQWRAKLPAAVGELVMNIAEAIVPVGLRPGPLLIGDFVGDFLAAEKIDVATTGPMVPFLTAQMDDYLRRVKSEMIARALLDLPVIVQGGAWDHVDFRGRRAQLRPGQDYEASRAIFAHELGIVDMSPNIDTGGHERVCRAAGSYSLVLTNRQGWIDQSLPGFGDLMFEFTPESIAGRAADAIGYPDRYLELAMAFGDRFREKFTPEALGKRVADLAVFASLQYARRKPVIQPYYSWIDIDPFEQG